MNDAPIPIVREIAVARSSTDTVQFAAFELTTAEGNKIRFCLPFDLLGDHISYCLLFAEQHAEGAQAPDYEHQILPAVISYPQKISISVRQTGDRPDVPVLVFRFGDVTLGFGVDAESIDRVLSWLRTYFQTSLG